MTDAATALKAFLDGQLSLDALLTRLDRLIVEGDGSDRALLDLIRNSPWRERLDADVLVAIEQRILAVAAVVRVNSASKGAATSRSAPPSGELQNDGDQTHLVATEKGSFRVGSTIKGRFELVEELGEGGMSKVFKALDRVRAEAMDRQPYVAIKVLSQVLRQSPHSVIALQREAKKALSLAHPNIVRVYDFDRAGPDFYMTMECLRGRSLDKIIRAPGFTNLPLERVLALIEPVAAALSHAHQCGIVHADLKPSNIFLTDDDQVKVIDFGIARAIEEPGTDGERTVFDPSSLGALTPRYASPEQCAGIAADPRDDVYALACVTYELLTSKHPFEGLSGLQAHVRQVQPARPPALDPRRWDALKRGFAFDRAARTARVAELIDGLKQGSGWRTGRRIAVAVAALVAVGVVAGAVALFFLPGEKWSASTPRVPPPSPVEVATPPPEPVAVSPPPPVAVPPVAPVVVRTAPQPVGEAAPAEGKESEGPPAASAVVPLLQPPKPSAAPQRPQKAATSPPASKKRDEPRPAEAARPPVQSRPAGSRCQDALARAQLGEPLSANDRRLLREDCQ